MKKKTLILLILISIFTIGKGFSQKKYVFTINSTKFEITQESLNVYFEQAYNEFVSTGYANQGDIDLWTDAFSVFERYLASEGLHIKAYGKTFSSMTITGVFFNNEQLGLTVDGKDLKRIKRKNAKKKDGLTERMCLLNSYMGKNLVLNAELN